MVPLSWFAWIAFNTYPGEVPGDAYQQGLTYNRTIADAEAQRSLDWAGALAAAPHGKSLDITFTLRDASGHPIDNAKVEARLIRPTQAGRDVRLMLASGGNGTYRGQAQLAWPGAWDLHVSATRGKDNYQQSQSIVLP